MTILLQPHMLAGHRASSAAPLHATVAPRHSSSCQPARGERPVPCQCAGHRLRAASLAISRLGVSTHLVKSAATDVVRDAPAEQHEDTDRETVQQESLSVLEWPAVCRQVAAFPELRRSALQIVVLGLQLGTSQVRDNVIVVYFSLPTTKLADSNLRCLHPHGLWTPVGDAGGERGAAAADRRGRESRLQPEGRV